MANASIKQLHARCDDGAFLEVRFTRRMRDLLVHRGMEMAYLTHFIRDSSTTPRYGLTVAQIESLMSLLEPMRSEVQRYDKVAIDALERELERALFAERSKGLLPDPELDVSNVIVTYMLAQTPSPARFGVGDQAISPTGEELTIVKPYGFHKVRHNDGRFYSKQGARIDYWWGYGVRAASGARYVARPCDLSDAEGRSTHLRLLQGADIAAPITGDVDD